MRTNGRRGRGARHAPGPKAPPKSLWGPDFNKPPSVATAKPTPKPKPKPKPRAKVGPYTKPVKYQPGHTYRTGQPVKLDDGETIITKSRTKTSRTAPMPSKKPLRIKVTRGNVTPRVGPRGISDISAGTLSLGGLADRAGRVAVGPNVVNAVEGKTFDPVWGGVELAGILPFGRIFKSGRAVAGIAKALDEGASLSEARAIARAHVSRLPADRNVPMVGRVLSSPQRHIRVAQRALDKNIAKTLARGEAKGLHPQEALAQKGLRASAARLRVSRLREAHGTGGFHAREGAQAAPKALAHVKLQPEQYVAMRQMAHNINPDVELKAINTRLTEAIMSGNKDAIRALHRDYQLVEESKKYLVGKGAGVEWRPNTPKRIKLVWNDLVRGSKNAEELHIRLGEISPEIAEARIHKPGEYTLAKAGYLAAKPAELQEVESKLESAITRLRDGIPSGAMDEAMSPAEYAAKFEESKRVYPTRAEAEKAADELLPRWRELSKGYASHEGRFYYRSKEASKLIQGQKGWSPWGWVKPARPGKETKQAYKNALRESGTEDINIPKVVGQTWLRRVNTSMADDLVRELRPHAMVGTLPKTGDVYNDFRAIPLYDNPASEARRKFLSAVDEAVSHPETTVGEMENLQDLHKQILKELSMQTREAPPGYGFVHKSLVKALEDPKLLRRGEMNKAQRVMMNISSLAKDMVVYSKIGHMPPRLASNMIMVMPDAGKDFLPALFALRKIYKADPSITKWIHEAMGGGYFKSFAETTGLPSKAVQNVSKHAVGWIEYTADRAPRNIAFLSFAMKDSGTRSVPELIKYLHSIRDAKPGTEAWYSRQRVLTHARQAAGEYNRVGGDAFVGNYIFLYRWLKTSTVWTSRFIAKHPLEAAALGYAVNEYVYQPKNAPWERFAVGGHNIQTSLPFSTPVEIGERLHTAGDSGKIPLGGGLLDQLNPAVETVANIAGHKNVETGYDLPMGKYYGAPIVAGLEQFARQTPPGALIWGKKSWTDKIEKFLGGNPLPTIKGKPKADLHKTLDKMVKKGILSRQDASEVQREIDSIKNDPEIQKLLAGK